MSRTLKIFLSATLVIVALLATAYVHFWVWAVVVINKSDRALSGIKIELAGKRLWEGGLAAGDSKRIFSIADGDGTAIASYELDKERVEINCGYIMGGPMANSVRFTLNPEHDGCAVED